MSLDDSWSKKTTHRAGVLLSTLTFNVYSCVRSVKWQMLEHHQETKVAILEQEACVFISESSLAIPITVSQPKGSASILQITQHMKPPTEDTLQHTKKSESPHYLHPPPPLLHLDTSSPKQIFDEPGMISSELAPNFSITLGPPIWSQLVFRQILTMIFFGFNAWGLFQSNRPSYPHFPICLVYDSRWQILINVHIYALGLP